MKILSSHKNTHALHPQTVWEILCSVWVVILIVCIVLGVWYFTKITQILDAPVEPVFVSSAAKIEEIQRNLDIVDAVIQKRIAK